MIKKNLKILIITSVAILLPLVAGIILWERLPEQIPSHWDINGNVDGWTSKDMSVFGFPALMLLLHWVSIFVTTSDPKRQNHSQKLLGLVFWLIPAISIFLSALTYSVAMDNEVHVEKIVPVILGVLFVFIGNYMPKCKQNYTVGIKLPWTLNSEENWNKTHRLAGWIWVAGGLIIAFSGFFNLLPIVIAVSVMMVAVPIVYSYVLHRKNV